MKHITKFGITILLLLFLVGIVSGVESTLEDWNSYNLGVSNGSGVYVDWGRESGDDFEITNAVTINDGYCLALSHGNSNDDIGWINLTTVQDYVGVISFSVKIDALGGNHRFRFYNNSVLSLRIRLNAVEHDIEACNIGGGAFVPIYDSTNLVTDAPSGIYHINVTHISGSSMNYSVYNATWGLLGSVITGTAVVDDWITFDKLEITTDGLSTVYLDDIAIYPLIAPSEDYAPVKLRDNPAFNDIEKAIIGVIGIIILVGFIYIISKTDFAKKEGSFAKLLVGILLAIILITVIFSVL